MSERRRCGGLGWRLHAGAAVLVLALLAMVAPLAQAQDPIDTYYGRAVDQGGWLQRMGWSWEPLQAAYDADRAFPTIAVVDSGIDVAHEEFMGDEAAIDPSSADCTSPPAKVTDRSFARLHDPVGHGTIVAGLAAAPANGVGIVGASPYSSILAVRIRQVGLVGLECALNYLSARMDAGATGLLVVNLSLSNPSGASPALRRAIAGLVRRGALVVAATGNFGDGNRIGYPARLPHVLAVGDSEQQARAPGAELDVLAPGGGLTVPLLHAGWGTPEEQPATSWSTALASGAAAAVWGAHDVTMTAQQLAWLLRKTATAGRNGRWSSRGGFGTIDVERALALKRVPRDDESEPNDTMRAASASGSAGTSPTLVCPHGCERYGLLGATDDVVDWWRVKRPVGRRVCARAVGAAATVRAGKGRISFVRVSTRRKLTNYRLVVTYGNRPSCR